jgi:hypothetical protein
MPAKPQFGRKAAVLLPDAAGRLTRRSFRLYFT